MVPPGDPQRHPKGHQRGFHLSSPPHILTERGALMGQGPLTGVARVAGRRLIEDKTKAGGVTETMGGGTTELISRNTMGPSHLRIINVSLKPCPS